MGQYSILSCKGKILLSVEPSGIKNQYYWHYCALTSLKLIFSLYCYNFVFHLSTHPVHSHSVFAHVVMHMVSHIQELKYMVYEIFYYRGTCRYHQ